MPWLRQIYKGMTAAQEEKGFDNWFRTIFFTLFVLHLLRRELLCFFFWGGGAGRGSRGVGGASGEGRGDGRGAIIGVEEGGGNVEGEVEVDDPRAGG